MTKRPAYGKWIRANPNLRISRCLNVLLICLESRIGFVRTSPPRILQLETRFIQLDSFQSDHLIPGEKLVHPRSFSSMACNWTCKCLDGPANGLADLTFAYASLRDKSSYFNK